MKKTYELTCLVLTNAQQPEKDKTVEEINNFIKEKGGEVVSVSSLTTVSLAYPIKQQDKADAVVFVFHFEDKDLPELKQELDKRKNILRYILIKTSLKKPFFPKRIARPGIQKVELNDIDQKIEEIFNPKKNESQ